MKAYGKNQKINYEKYIGLSAREVAKDLFKGDQIRIQNSYAFFSKEELKRNCEWNAGARDFIKFLNHKQVTLGIVTSSVRKKVIKFLKSENALRNFAFIISLEDVKNRKPSPEPYAKAISQSIFPIDKTIAIEDSRAGLISARTAGLECIFIKPKKTDTIKTWQQMTGLIG